jgi:Leucine-rich repeat (LRR) protein
MDTFRTRALQPGADVRIPTCFPNLVAIGIRECSGLMHIEALPTFCNTLRALDFTRSDCSRADMAVLASCTNLEKLHLGQSGLLNLSFLPACINLVYVNLRASDIEDISPISACTKLVRVNCSSNLEINDISPLSTLTNLRHLDLSYCPKIASLAPLSMCTTLQSLDNTANDGVQDISPLSRLTNLRFLKLGFNLGIDSLAPLSMCTTLQELDLTGNQDLGLQVQVLAPCTNLIWLVLARCNLPDNTHPFEKRWGKACACKILSHEESNMPFHYHEVDLMTVL